MTNRKSYGRIQWYHFGPSRVTQIKGYRPPIWEAVYMSEVNGTRKVKYDAKTRTRTQTPCRNLFLGEFLVIF